MCFAGRSLKTRIKCLLHLACLNLLNRPLLSRDHQSQIEDLNATLTSKIEDLEGQMSDLQNNLTAQQTQIDSLNASILELQDRVETLESLSGFPTPDYDSGWTPIANACMLSL